VCCLPARNGQLAPPRALCIRPGAHDSPTLPRAAKRTEMALRVQTTPHPTGPQPSFIPVCRTPVGNPYLSDIRPVRKHEGLQLAAIDQPLTCTFNGNGTLAQGGSALPSRNREGRRKLTNVRAQNAVIVTVRRWTGSRRAFHCGKHVVPAVAARCRLGECAVGRMCPGGGQQRRQFRQQPLQLQPGTGQ